ncbi:MAG TPA: DUF1549 domain-containing protein [Urbifossiella sp.]|nr:DUF1549 domain-containing protein [Urbifossiella sp.]
MIRLSLVRAAIAGGLLSAFAVVSSAQSPGEKAALAAPVATQALKINEYILKGYESAGIKRASDKSTDNEFLRRAFIDLIGRIPSLDEVVDFERDKSADKRVKLVRRLMHVDEYAPKGANGQPVTTEYTDGNGKRQKEILKFNYKKEYADHWAEVWTVWLMTRSGHQDYRDQMRVWLEKKFETDTNHKEMVTRLLTATGQVGGTKTAAGWTFKEDYAANYIVHHLGDPIRDDKETEVNERTRDGAFDGVPVTSRTTKLFLGLQTQCTQCHDHPFNKEWVQADFWGVNAFFRQTVRSATPSGNPVGNNQKMANATPVTLTDDAELNTTMIALYERRDGRKIGSFPVMLKDYDAAINGQKSTKMLMAAPNGKSRRAQLAEWVTGHDNFGKAYANRMWAHFFGRGVNKDPSPDDFGSNNEIVHPELLNYLGEEFVKYGHNPKAMMEWICTSDAYSLSHVARKEYTDIKYDPFFARMPLKSMSPESLFESLMTATSPRKMTPTQKDARMAARDAWMRKLVRQFGDDEGNELSFNGTIVQALLMMNGKELNDEIGVGRNAPAGKGLIEDMLSKNQSSPGRMYDDLFLMTLSRHPTPAEVARLEDVRTGKAVVSLGPTPAPKGKGPVPKTGGPVAVATGAYANDPGYYRDVLWALLNTNEFMINH